MWQKESLARQQAARFAQFVLSLFFWGGGCFVSFFVFLFFSFRCGTESESVTFKHCSRGGDQGVKVCVRVCVRVGRVYTLMERDARLAKLRWPRVQHPDSVVGCLWKITIIFRHPPNNTPPQHHLCPSLPHLQHPQPAELGFCCLFFFFRSNYIW